MHGAKHLTRATRALVAGTVALATMAALPALTARARVRAEGRG